ncbi:MAG: hypothetical protein N4A38_02510 [Candidatus Gracilibacteria bacterium]|nr:hypothetical protein [Candidatus Gracilibacteria bacterium]
MRNRKSSKFKQIFNKNFINKIKQKFKKNKRKNTNPETFFQIKDKFYDLGKNKAKFKSKRGAYKMFKQKIEFKDLKQSLKETNYTPYYFGLGGFLVLGVIYILFFSSYFAINAVYIERTDDLSNIDIAYNVVPDLYGKPILTINKNKIIKSLKDLQANLNKVEISRVYPTSLKILLTSYKGEFNTIINGKKYLLLENGSLVPGGYKESLSSLKIHLEDEDTLSLLGYSAFVNEKDITALSIIKQLFLKNFGSLEVESYDYFPLEREIHINLVGKNTKLIFDLVTDPKDQLNRLKLLMNENSLEELVYADLRIEGKIFYCGKKDERDWNNIPKCQNNLEQIYNYKF